MGSMKRLSLSLFLLTMVFPTAQIVAQTGVEVPELTSIDDAVQAFMGKWSVPGGSVAITYQERLVYARGFGLADVDAELPVDPSHVFRIASVSKSITGIAIAKLIEDGLLEKNDLVFGPSGILSEAPYDVLNDARMERVTVGQLLHHTSGFSRLVSNRDPVFADVFVAGQTGWPLPHDPATKIEYYLKNELLGRDPGTGYEYSNLGYLILGRVIEAVTGLSYEEYCRSVLFEPNDIETIRMGQSLLENTYDNEVRYYGYPGVGTGQSVYGTGEFVPWHYGGINVETFDSHGGWTASASDLLRLLVSVDGFSNKPDILAAATIQTMTTPSTTSGNYAFGFAVNSINNWWHVGSIAGATAEWVRSSNGLNWTLLFNTRPSPSQNDQFIREMDALIWSVLPGITSWPDHDLFEAENQKTVTGIRINEVSHGEVDFMGFTNWIELYNAGDSEVDISNLILCDSPECPSISSLSVLSGSVILPAGGYIVLYWSELDGDSEVGLYQAHAQGDFGNSDLIIDYMQYASPGHQREGTAVEAGVWTAQGFVALAGTNESLQFFDNAMVGPGNWGAAPATPGEANKLLQTSNEVFDVPTLFRLHGNYPNPFSRKTTISYDLSNAGQVTLSVYSVLGQEIASLVDGVLPAGSYKAVWLGRDNQGKAVPSGTYLYRLTYDDGETQSRVMTLFK